MRKIILFIFLLNFSLGAEDPYFVTRTILSMKNHSSANEEGNRFVYVDKKTSAVFYQQEIDEFVEIKSIILNSVITRFKYSQLEKVRQEIAEQSESIEKLADQYTSCKITTTMILDEKTGFLRELQKWECSTNLPQN